MAVIVIIAVISALIGLVIYLAYQNGKRDRTNELYSKAAKKSKATTDEFVKPPKSKDEVIDNL